MRLSLPRQAYSHSASVGKCPPTQAAYALACSQFTSVTGCLANCPLSQRRLFGSLHPFASTQRLYCSFVTSVRSIQYPSSLTVCVGCSSGGQLSRPACLHCSSVLPMMNWPGSIHI